jgi:hypothetical protein
MPRNAGGTYTRISNSFSNPVTGTPIDPNHAEALFDELETEVTDSLSRAGKGGMLAALVPDADDGHALGTTAKKWADLFLAAGAVVNFNAGNLTLTHSAGDLALAGGTLTLPNTGLHILDTDGSHDLVIAAAENLSADRTLSIVTGNTSRTLTINGDHTLPLGTSAVLSGGQTLTGGFAATSFAAGTKSTGTFTPDPASGNVQHAVNGGAHTLAPPSNPCSMMIEYENNGSAGAITTSGFTKVIGSFTTTSGHKFHCFITKGSSYSSLTIFALQ